MLHSYTTANASFSNHLCMKTTGKLADFHHVHAGKLESRCDHPEKTWDPRGGHPTEISRDATRSFPGVPGSCAVGDGSRKSTQFVKPPRVFVSERRSARSPCACAPKLDMTQKPRKSRRATVRIEGK